MHYHLHSSGIRKRVSDIIPCRSLLIFASFACYFSAGKYAAPRDLEYVAEVMETQALRTKSITDQRKSIKRETERLRAELDVVDSTIRAAGGVGRKPNTYRTERRATVGIRVDKPCEVELRLWYLTSNASWSASYGMFYTKLYLWVCVFLQVNGRVCGLERREIILVYVFKRSLSAVY